MRIADASTITKGKYITFCFTGLSQSGKTKIFDVVSADNYVLGRIEWFSRWRKYALFSYSLSIFEETCLQDIADFIKAQTKAHRSAKRANKCCPTSTS